MENLTSKYNIDYIETSALLNYNIKNLLITYG